MKVLEPSRTINGQARQRAYHSGRLFDGSFFFFFATAGMRAGTRCAWRPDMVTAVAAMMLQVAAVMLQTAAVMVRWRR